MQQAIARGSMPWNRSKVMLVGEGRVGKTALCNSMMGKPFEETESTVGLTQLTCDVRTVATGRNGRWVEHTKPEREYEASVAQLIKSMEVGMGSAINDTNLTVKESLSTETDSIEGEHLAAGSSFTNVGEKSNLLSLNESLVFKYLSQADVANRCILSVLDFGGQSVFNIIHHLFLTSCGVYIVVFNMMDILDDNKREQSLSEISFWINSIVMHTCDEVNEKIAPMFLVGTHKDRVNDATNFERISQSIEDRFRYNPGWPYIVDNNNSFSFFPVNNVLGQGDEEIVDLMTKIVEVVTEADYVKAPRPLSWLKALDELMATKKSYLTMTEASSIAITNGVEAYAVPLFLSFLNEMGVVLWLDETGLRDVVILDVITFFVEPATLIICNHIAQPSDSTVHHKKIQEICKRKRAVEWDEMTQRGLLSRPLVELLVHKIGENDIPAIINIMLKYGLIVRLDGTHYTDRDMNTFVAQPPVYYLVPALLPRTVGNLYTFQDDQWKSIRHSVSCYFVFTVDARMHSAKSYNFSSLQNEGFLPRGLMERLIGKAAQWSQLTNIIDIHDITRLYQNYALLSYGNQRFRLVCIPEINCIRLDIEGEHPLPIHNRISEQINICIKECMGSLQFITALQLGTVSDSSQGLSLLNLQALRDVHEKNLSLVVNDIPPVNRQYVSSNYGPWLVDNDMLSSYDVFISHRWNKDDDEVIDQLNEFILGFTVCSEKRAVQVFDDKVMLKRGQQFQNVMARVLINSTIFVPLLSTAALQRMLAHNPAEEDNVLIEWMLAVECMQNPTQSKVRHIYPLLFGERNDDGSVGVLFYEGIFDRLPDVIPTASIEAVRKLLKENNVNVSSSSSNRTVRDIVGEISKYYGLPGWDYSSNELVGIFTETIVNIINEIYDNANVRKYNIVRMIS